MSFQSYIGNIEEKTGKKTSLPEPCRRESLYKKGELVVKATEVTNWLKEELELVHVRVMAMYAYIKGKRE